MTRKPLSKVELVDTVALTAGVTYDEAHRVLDGLATVVADEVHSGVKVNVPGIGSVEPVGHAPKPKRLVYFGQEEHVAPPKPATVTLKLRPARSLKTMTPSPRSKVGRELTHSQTSKRGDKRVTSLFHIEAA